MTDTQYITNPKTGRPVLIGGRIWRKLISEGIIESQNAPVDRKIQFKTESADQVQELAPEPEPSPKKVIKNNKHRKVPTQKEISKYTSDASIKVFNSIKGDPVYQEMEEEELSKHLEKLIMEELINNKELTDKILFATQKIPDESESDSESESEESD